MAAPAIGKRRRWQPPVTAKLDTGHPLAAGLARCYLSDGQSWIDLANGGRRMTPGTTDRNAAAVGVFGRASAQWALDPQFSATNELGALNRATLSVAVTCGTLDRGNEGGMTHLFGDEPGNHGMFRFGGAGAFNQLELNSSLASIDSTTTFVAGQSFAASGRFDSAGSSVWVNGKREATNGTTSSSAIDSQQVPINRTSSSSVRTGIHGVHIALWHARALTDAEIGMFAGDPFQMLRW